VGWGGGELCRGRAFFFFFFFLAFFLAAATLERFALGAADACGEEPPVGMDGFGRVVLEGADTPPDELAEAAAGHAQAATATTRQSRRRPREGIRQASVVDGTTANPAGPLRTDG
jgi:hypothetical protein